MDAFCVPGLLEANPLLVITKGASIVTWRSGLPINVSLNANGMGTRHAAEFRWEMFNMFNTVNFANPAATVGNTNFGVITNAGDPRVMQLAIRYQF